MLELISLNTIQQLFVGHDIEGLDINALVGQIKQYCLRLDTAVIFLRKEL